MLVSNMREFFDKDTVYPEFSKTKKQGWFSSDFRPDPIRGIKSPELNYPDPEFNYRVVSRIGSGRKSELNQPWKKTSY